MGEECLEDPQLKIVHQVRGKDRVKIETQLSELGVKCIL